MSRKGVLVNPFQVNPDARVEDVVRGLTWAAWDSDVPALLISGQIMLRSNPDGFGVTARVVPLGKK